MKGINSKLASASLLALVIIFASVAQAQARETAKPLRLVWEAIEGYEKYQVQIMDASGNIVLDRAVDANYVEFILPLGAYKFRIAAINKFDKIGFWSDWDTFEIRQKIKYEFFTSDYVERVGLKISGGAAYTMLLSPWNKLYHDTYNNYILTIGFHLGNSKFFKSSNFLRFTGIELEGCYSLLHNKKSIILSSSLKNLSGGLNLFIKTNLKIPLNFYLTAGGGINITEQQNLRYYFNVDLPLKAIVKSQDPYGKVGASVELNFLYALSLNVGADYYMIFYRDKPLSSLRYFALVGVRI